MRETLEVGDCCQFMTGGPTMTVVEIVPQPKLDGEPLYKCGWFDCRNDYRTALFPLLALIKLFMFSFQCEKEERRLEDEVGDEDDGD